MSRSCSNWIEVANGNQDICLPIQRRWEAEETQPTLPDSLSLFEILQRQPIIPRSNGIIRIRIPNAQVTLPLNSFPYQCHLFLCHLNLLRLLFPLLPSHHLLPTSSATLRLLSTYSTGAKKTWSEVSGRERHRNPIGVCVKS